MNTILLRWKNQEDNKVLERISNNGEKLVKDFLNKISKGMLLLLKVNSQKANKKE